MGSICKTSRKDVVIDAHFEAVTNKKSGPNGRRSTRDEMNGVGGLVSGPRDRKAKILRDSVTQESAVYAPVQQEMNEHDRKLVRTALSKQFIFSSLGENLEPIINQMRLFVMREGETVFEQGRTASHFFVVSSGRLEVFIDSLRTSTLKRGNVCGEQALLHRSTLNSTVKAHEKSELWGLDRVAFKKAIEATIIANYEQNQLFIGTVKLFESLSGTQKGALVESLVTHKFEAGQNIVTEGEVGDLFFLIKEGTVKCTKGGVELRRMSRGEFFGEQALLHDSVRTATITALGQVKCLSIDRDTLTQILGSQLQQIIYRNSIRISLEQSRYLGRLNKEQIEAIAAAAVIKSYTSGEIVVPAAQEYGQRIWMILKGRVIGEIELEMFATVGDEGAFDDMCVEFQDMIAEGDVDIATVSKSEVEAAIGGDFNSVVKYTEAMAAMNCISLLRGLSESQKSQVIDQVNLIEFKAGESVFKEGDASELFYFIKSGVATVSHGPRIVRYLNKNSIFGERGLLNNLPRSADVTALTDLACWTLNRTAFYSLLDAHVREKLENQAHLQNDSIELDDLKAVRVLGKGMFGVAILVTYGGSFYAMKGVSRFKALKHGIYENLLRERELLLQVEHPFIMKLVKTFKDKDWIYYLTEYVCGADMFDVIREIGVLSDAQAQFYVGCLMLALRYLHERDILYRDLKPENVIIDMTGYPKLIDFGTAKKVTGRTITVVGTPHYMAPEVITSQGYGCSADYWSLGVIFYELVCGMVPFAEDQDDPYKIYELILTGRFEFPDSLRQRPQVSELITSLLNKNPALRMGVAERLPTHPWFSSMDWHHLEDRGVSAPYIPRVNCPSVPTTCLLPISQAYAEHETGVIPPTRRVQEGWDSVF